MKRVAAALALALAAFLATGASGGVTRAGVTYAPCPAGAEGTALSPQDPEQHVVMDKDHYETVCNYYPGGNFSGTSKLTLQGDWVVPGGATNIYGVCGVKSPSTTTIGSQTHEARVTAFGFTPATPDAAWKAVMQKMLTSEEALAVSCAGGSKVEKIPFLVSARADATKAHGIPLTKLYADTDVKGAGAVSVDTATNDVVAQFATFKVKHEYISDRFPDITMTLTAQKGGVYRKLPSGSQAIRLPVKVTASSSASCKGDTGYVVLSAAVRPSRSEVDIVVCGIAVYLVDGRGPKGLDPTNDVTVSIS